MTNQTNSNEHRLFLAKIEELAAVLKRSLEAEIQALDDFLSFLHQNVVKEYDVSKISWMEAEGPNGLYERAYEDTADFNLLVKDLKEHGGRLTQDGFFYWIFDRDSTVGRKGRNGK